MKRETKIILAIIAAVACIAAIVAAIVYFREDIQEFISGLTNRENEPDAPTYTPEEQEDFADI